MLTHEERRRLKQQVSDKLRERILTARAVERELAKQTRPSRKRAA